MKTNWNLQQARMIALAAVATCLAFASAPVQATLTYNSGGIVNVSTPQSDVSSLIRVDISNGTTVNWLAGADYSPTVNTVSAVDEIAFQLAGSSVLNLSGGNLTALDSDANGLSLIGNVTGDFSGSISMSGGTFNITESGNGAALGFSFVTNGLAPMTFSASGGSLTLTESDGGNARLFDISGGARINATISGGTFTVNEANNGTAKFFHIGGAETVAKVTVTGGNFSLTEGAAGDAYVFDVGSVGSELTIRGGTFSVPAGATNNVDNGAVYLFGTFPGVSDGVYTDANWIDGTLVGGTLELGGTLGDAYTVVGGSGRLYINTVPEPSTFALVGLGLFGWLAFRRRRVSGS